MIEEENPRQRLSFLEQLQSQIQLCREALSDPKVPLTPRVETLELLLWAKLKEDKEYCETIEGLKKRLEEKREILKKEVEYWKLEDRLTPYVRNNSKEKFRAIMIFIDKRGYMPIE